MARQELIDLIKKSVAQGSGREQLISDLIFAGFSYQEIQGALNEMSQKSELPQNFFSGAGRGRARASFNPHIQKIGEAAGGEIIQEEETAKKLISKYKKIGIMTLIVIIVLILGGGIGLYIYSTSPSVVVRKALSTLSNTRSFGYYLLSDAAVRGENIADDKFTQSIIPYESTAIISRGIVNLTDNEGGLIDFSIETGISQNTNPSAPLLWDMGVISASGHLFLKLDALSTTTSLSQTLISQLMPQWVTLDVTSTDQLNLFMPKRFAQELFNYQNLSLQDILQTEDRLSDPTVIKSVVDLGTEQINNVNTRHYRILFDAQKIESIIQEFYQLKGERGSWLSALFDNSWDVWISSDTGMLYRVMVVPGQQQNVAFELKNIDLYLSGFNSQPKISAPQAVSLSDIFKVVSASQ